MCGKCSSNDTSGGFLCGSEMGCSTLRGVFSTLRPPSGRAGQGDGSA